MVDTNGNAIGTLVDGKAVGLDGASLGSVEKDVALDADGRVIDMRSSQVQTQAEDQGHERLVVRDASGKIIGFIVGEEIHDAKGTVIGSYRDGNAYGLDGKIMGQVGTAMFDANGNLIGELGQVLRDAAGKVIGTVVDGQLLDANGNVLGVVKNGQVVDASGKVLGQVEPAMLDADGKVMADAARVVRDADGKVLGSLVGNDIVDAQGRKVGSVKDGQVRDLSGQAISGANVGLQKDVVQVVRDANGNILGTLRGNTVYGSDGKVIGTLVDGKIVDANGNVLYRGVTVSLEPPPSGAGDKKKRSDVARMIQFIPGGTGKEGVIPIQTLRLE